MRRLKTPRKMPLLRRRLIRVGLFVFAATALWNLYNGNISSLFSAWTHKNPSKETLNSLSLTEEQCKATFPNLNHEIDEAVARGPFRLKKEPDDYMGLVQAKIKNGKLYIISVEKRPNRDMLSERQAVLHQIHRAIVTSPEPLPDTAIIFSIIDYPHEHGWSFCRTNDPNVVKGNWWVMPHFSFWSWPFAFIGTVDEALEKIDRVEKATPFEKKIDKLAWRGTAHYNGVGNQFLRPNLLFTTKGKGWADVETLNWDTNAEKANNSIDIHEFCKYKYIAYTEGITYSGRLLFHTACESVIITPPVSYLMHTTHLMRPLYSSSLPFSKTEQKKDPRWPKTYSPSTANIIFVDHEWNDLEETVLWLQANPDIAKGIAKRQREMVVDAGYLSPAAEACYWRSLIRGWSEVAQIDEKEWGAWDAEGPENGEGIRWETFSLNSKTRWD